MNCAEMYREWTKSEKKTQRARDTEWSRNDKYWICRHWENGKRWNINSISLWHTTSIDFKYRKLTMKDGADALSTPFKPHIRCGRCKMKSNRIKFHSHKKQFYTPLTYGCCCWLELATVSEQQMALLWRYPEWERALSVCWTNMKINSRLPLHTQRFHLSYRSTLLHASYFKINRSGAEKMSTRHFTFILHPPTSHPLWNSSIFSLSNLFLCWSWIMKTSAEARRRNEIKYKTEVRVRHILHDFFSGLFFSIHITYSRLRYGRACQQGSNTRL